MGMMCAFLGRFSRLWPHRDLRTIPRERANMITDAAADPRKYFPGVFGRKRRTKTNQDSLCLVVTV